MTREQALGPYGDLIRECEDTPGINGLINAIYDDFEAQICNNCSYFGEYVYEIPGAEDFEATATGCILLHAPNSDTRIGGCKKFKPTN